MIEIEVRFFGSLRQLVGTARQVVSLDGEARLADLVDYLGRAYGSSFGQELARIRGVRILVNGREYTQVGGLQAPLADGWTVAFLPPIFGG